MISVIEKQYMETVIRMGKRMLNDCPDREQRRYEIAKDAMCALLSNPAIVKGVTKEGEPIWGTPSAISKTAVVLSDLL